MRFCEECGAPLEDDALFCEECGTPVESGKADEQQEEAAVADTENVPDENPKEETETEVDRTTDGEGESELETVPETKEEPKQREGEEPAKAAEVTEEPKQREEESAKVPEATEEPKQREEPEPTKAAEVTEEPKQREEESAKVSEAAEKPEQKKEKSAKVPEVTEVPKQKKETEPKKEPKAAQSVESEPKVTVPKKRKKKGFVIGGILAGVVIAAAIVAVVLWQGDFSAKKTSAPTENPYPTEKPLENALDQKKQSGTSKKSKSEKSKTTAKSKKKNTESKLQKQWNGTYVIKDDTAALRFRIILHSKDNIEIEYVQDEYEEGVSYAKLTAALSDKNTFEVTDADWTSISSAMLSDDTDTLSVYSEDGDLAGEFERSTQYVIPDSSTRKLTKSDVKGLSSDELRIARNEIYARHGRMFDDIELQQHFYDTDWYIAYQEADQFDENKELSKIEKYNVKFISKYE